jgi:hypothetical protein
MQTPQFDTQNDPSVGDGIHSIPQWLGVSTPPGDVPSRVNERDLDPEIRDVLFRLGHVFHASQPHGLSTTDLHDLTCFVLHKLLAWSPQAEQFSSSESVTTSQCVRYAVVIYMLMIHGPAYFSHKYLQATLVSELQGHLGGILDSLMVCHRPLALWMLLVGVVASHGTSEYYWFTTQVKILVELLQLYDWEDVVSCLEEVLWFKTKRAERLFQSRWEEMWAMSTT